jgi:hypothetical protein
VRRTAAVASLLAPRHEASRVTACGRCGDSILGGADDGRRWLEAHRASHHRELAAAETQAGAVDAAPAFDRRMRQALRGERRATTTAPDALSATPMPTASPMLASPQLNPPSTLRTTTIG